MTTTRLNTISSQHSSMPLAHKDTAAATAKPLAVEAAVSALQFMLKLEADVRATKTVAELAFLAVNGARKLTNARQVFLLRATGPRSFKIMSISSMASVEGESPLVLWVERMAARIAKDAVSAKTICFSLPAYCMAEDAETGTYPFREMLWVPLNDLGGATVAGLLLAREQPWTQDSQAPIARFAEACAYSWDLLTRPLAARWKRRVNRRVLLAGVALIALLAFVPVPMTALAPAEVVARAPTVIAAPIEGLIDEILVDPSSRVKAGDVLFRFNDTQARNAAEVAEREVEVAEAKLRQARQGAFVDAAYNHDVAIAQTNLSVKKSERDYARDLLTKSTVVADRDGLVLYSDKRDLIGRPVAIGQRVMEISDPDDVALRILLPVDDAAVIGKDAAVRLFLDSDPLHPISGIATRTSHIARLNEGNQLSFAIHAAPQVQGRPPRLGLRGTAQVFGSRVPLAYFLFRRPLTYMRQRLGI